MIDWNPELEDEIVTRITAGESIKSIFDSPGFPARKSFYIHCAKDEAFYTRIARARKAGAWAQFDDFLDLSDKANEENANAIKVRLWARTWVLGRLNPKEMGDKVHLDGEIKVEKRVITDI